MAPLAVRSFTASSALGLGLDALHRAVAEQRSSLLANTWKGANGAALACFVGRMPALDDSALPAPWNAWDCRATRLAWQALQADGFADAARAAVQRHGAARVGLVLGSSASTIGASELAYRKLAPDGGFPAELRAPALHSPHAVTAFVAQALGLAGPAVTVSTACSSSARAFGQVERWLRLGLVDAVVVGGVDALCDSVLYGFHALGLVAPTPCQPFDAQRCGISVGEGAGFVLLERADPVGDTGTHDGLQLWGYGEASDAHHMSSPHPQGLGAERALDDALARAKTAAENIDFVHLHGTATPQNDAVEAALVARRYSHAVHACATKGLTGHTMGAAGVLGAVVCLLALRTGLRAGTAQLQKLDPALGPRFAQQLRRLPTVAPVRATVSHAFGFGGNNSVLVFGHGHGHLQGQGQVQAQGQEQGQGQGRA